jgi:hypothetical protein
VRPNYARSKSFMGVAFDKIYQKAVDVEVLGVSAL